VLEGGKKKGRPEGRPRSSGRKLCPAATKSPPNALASVNDFAVQGEIETVALHLVGDAQPDGDVDNL
jgi:hypothetical protein